MENYRSPKLHEEGISLSGLGKVCGLAAALAALVIYAGAVFETLKASSRLKSGAQRTLIEKTASYAGHKSNASVWEWRGERGRQIFLSDTTRRYTNVAGDFPDSRGTWVIADYGIPENHPLRKYANPDSLEKLFHYTMQWGVEVKE